jgi:hypothetical protein
MSDNNHKIINIKNNNTKYDIELTNVKKINVNKNDNTKKTNIYKNNDIAPLDGFTLKKLLFNINSNEGSIFFDFKGIYNINVISSIFIINLNDFIDSDYLNDFLNTNFKFNTITLLKSLIDNFTKKNTNFKSILNIKLLFNSFYGCVPIFYLDISNILSNIISKDKKFQFKNNNNDINDNFMSIIKMKCELLISIINYVLKLNIYDNYFINIEYGYHLLNRDGFYKFMNNYLNTNDLFINNNINDYKFLIGVENNSIMNLKIIISNFIKFINIDILNRFFDIYNVKLTNNNIKLKTFYNYINTYYNLDIKSLNKQNNITYYDNYNIFNKYYNFNYYNIKKYNDNTINNNDKYNIDFNDNYNDKYSAKIINKNDKDIITNSNIPRSIYKNKLIKFIKNVDNIKNNYKNEIKKKDNNYIKNNIKTTIEQIIKYDKNNNWIININTNPVYDYIINEGIEDIIMSLFKNDNKINITHNYNKYTPSSGNNIFSIINDKLNDKLNNNDNINNTNDKLNKSNIIELTCEFMKPSTNSFNNYFTPLYGNNDKYSLTKSLENILGNNINLATKIIPIKTNSNNTGKKIRLIKVFIYTNLNINKIVDIILRKIKLMDIQNNNSNICNIILLIDQYSNEKKSNIIKSILNNKLNDFSDKKSKIIFSNLFINIKINSYIRKCLAYISYQNKFIKLGITHINYNSLIIKRLNYYNKYTKYLNYINNLDIKINLDIKNNLKNEKNNLDIKNNLKNEKNNLDIKNNLKNEKNNLDIKNNHCSCCKCLSRHNNYYLEYKYIPYLTNNLNDKLNNDNDYYYWIYN